MTRLSVWWRKRTPIQSKPTFDDAYAVGTLAKPVKVIRLGPANYSVVLNGLSRFRVEKSLGLEPYMQAEITRLAEPVGDPKLLEELGQRLRDRTRRALELMPNLPRETTGILDNVREPGALADLIASNFPEEQASIAVRQSILEALDPVERLRAVLGLVDRQLEVLRVKDEITALVKDEMSRSQRDFVLRQQMRGIREELGEGGDDDEIEDLRERIARAELPPEAAEAARKQLGRLSGMQSSSAEFQTTRNYVEWLADLPWNRTTPDRFDIKVVKRCLEEDHFGLDRVKRRIVEYAAIRQLRKDKRGPILLFAGPPGVGKTSLGRSIARAMGRRYGRIALGGVRDEAEIRGHRRTYVGALPGRIIQALKKAGTKNPVLVLDEVDKLGVDMRGDPAAALLEVLDPAQNDSFVDHYLGVPFDLSQITFLATANYKYQIPEALKDRMEMIEVPGYTRMEKRNIAQLFLVPKQLKEHALDESRLKFTDLGIETIIDYYTHEAGVRGVEREIASVCREATVRIADGEEVKGERVDREHVERVLGVHTHRPEVADRKFAPGAATGLSVTGAGGESVGRRGHAHARQGQCSRDRQHAQCDEGIRGHGGLLRSLPCGAAAPRPRVAKEHRSTPACTQRWLGSGCGRRGPADVRRGCVSTSGCARPTRRCHHRGDHSSRKHPPRQRDQRQTTGCPPCRDPRGRHAKAQRTGSGRAPGRNTGGGSDPLGQSDRRSLAARARRA